MEGDADQTHWYINEHNHNKERNKHIDVIEVEGAMGQVDIYVCSSKCLRAFFSKIVDDLESSDAV